MSFVVAVIGCRDGPQASVFGVAMWREIHCVRVVLAYWVHDLSPFLIEFSDGVGIRWYGLSYLAGFAVALWLLRTYEKAGRSPLNADQRMTLMTALVVGTIVGGRLGYVLLYGFGKFLNDPLFLVRVWDGGMASHGGIVGIIAALFWFSRWHQKQTQAPVAACETSPTTAGMSFWRVSDLVCTVGAPGVIFGRIANFINGELWGKITNVPWAVIFPESASAIRAETTVQAMTFVSRDGLPLYAYPRHPSQLYAAALEGLVLLAYLQWRFWKSGVTRRHPGQLAGECLAAYAVLRVLSELFREPDAALILGLSRGTFYSLLLCLAGLIIIVYRRNVTRAAPAV